jgi:hypothetical protein
MVAKVLKRYYVLLILLLVGSNSFGQNVPLGIFYQAVARDNYGKELVNKDIDVKFSIISGNPLGTVVYQELHSKVNTSKFGVFSLIIGHGTPTGGTYGELSQIQWGQAYHYLKIEVKFDNDFIDMGTIQFLAVPYALYAQKSLEPGPAGAKGDPGPKGDPGDPASDKQTLSFDQNNLTISGGNAVPLTSLLQSLTITNTPEGNFLGISRGNSVLLASAEADGDPTNEIQDLIYDASKRELRLLKSLAPPIDLNELKNDADSDPTNEIQAITYNPENYQLTLTKGGGIATINQIVAFRAGMTSTVNLADNTPVNLIFDQVLPEPSYYNDGGFYNNSTGVFTAPYNGIYSFRININLPTSSVLIIKVRGTNYETLIGPTTLGGTYKESITVKLNKNDIVNITVTQTNGYPIPFNFSGSFSGFRLY